MIRALKSALCWFFGAAALLLTPAIVLAIRGIADVKENTSPLASYIVLVGFFAVPMVYGIAWWTARKPRTGPNGWAIVACVLNIAINGFLFSYVQPLNLTFVAVSLLVVSASTGGIIVFTLRETAPDPVRKRPAKRARIPGDRTHPWFDGVHSILSVAAIWWATSLWMKWAETRGLSSSSSLFVPLPVIAVGYFTTLMLHESGHALAAHSFQMKMLSFSAGPFQWRKQEGSWKFKITASRLFGGSVNVVPTNPHQPRWQDVCMIFAGPAANLCSGLLFVWAALHAPGNPWQAAWFYLSFTASFSFIVAFSNLLPFRTKKGSYSDGARILQLFTNSPVNEFHQTLHRLQSTLVTPLRFRDLDPDAFRRVADRYATELTGLHLRLCAVGIFEDSGRIPEARSELAAAQIIYDTFTIDLPVPLHTVFIIDHAYLNRDAAAARLWWSRMKAKKAEPLTVDYWLARTALLWIEGRLREAEEAWQKADSKAQKLPRFGGYEFDRYRCAILREELDQAHVAAQEASYATAELRAP